MLWLTGGLAVAATVILVFALQARRHLPVPAGTMITSTGPLLRGDGTIVPVAGKVMTGETLTTGAGIRAALRLAGGPTVRLDETTRVVMKGVTRLELSDGTIYLESDDGARGHVDLEVETKAGIVRDVGTRFEVRASQGETRVRVRQGLVSLARGSGSEQVAAGGELTIDASGGARRGTIQAFDPSWSWILDAAPGFEMEGRTLGAFLDWVSSETGLRVTFAPASAGSQASGIVLHGSVAGLKPEVAAAVVLPTCGLGHRIEGDAFVVFPAPREQK